MIPNETLKCICANLSRSEYVVRIRNGSTCLLTTNRSCYNYEDAEAGFELHAGFKSDYAIQEEAVLHAVG